MKRKNCSEGIKFKDGEVLESAGILFPVDCALDMRRSHRNIDVGIGHSREQNSGEGKRGCGCGLR